MVTFWGRGPVTVSTAAVCLGASVVFWPVQALGPTESAGVTHLPIEVAIPSVPGDVVVDHLPIEVAIPSNTGDVVVDHIIIEIVRPVVFERPPDNDDDGGIIGPIVWVEWPRTGSSPVVTDVFSDIDLQDPADYYAGFKQARIEAFGDAERVLSDPWTGEWRGGSYRFRVNDALRDITRRKASATERFWTSALAVRMITRAARAQLETPWSVWVGPVIDAQPQGLSWDITLGDIVSQKLLSDAHQLPWRMIRDGFLTTELDEINPDLDLDQPEPIIYGKHRRVAGIDLPSPEGFCYKPALLGKRTVDGTQYHVWLVAGHACKEIDALRVDDVVTTEADGFLIPGHANHLSVFGTSYEDIVSSTFGNVRRYTLVHGVVGSTIPDACAAGDSVLTVSIEGGIETVGDGTGSLISDRFLQYKHFCINFVAHHGPDSYQSGDWLTNPTWAIYDADVPIVDSYSFDDCAAIGVERLPDNNGYIGAAIIGANAGDQSSVRRWIADWNRSCGCQFGITHRGRIRITLLHPTEDIKAAATLYDDATEILDGSFSTSFDWDGQANHVRFRADFEYSTGQWRTDGVAIHTESVAGYGAIPSPLREYPFAPGITATNHLAVLESRIRAHPPQVVTLEATIGHHPITLDSLGYTELGDYIRYKHFAGVGEEGQIRLGQVIGHVVLTGQRRVRVTLLDCEDLIGFDEFEG